MPKISVIVPVYKVEQYLDRCVKSILAQTFADFELILIDDGSPDNCPAMCDEWKIKDDRITVIHQENGGLSSARNAGIDWVFANSDSGWLTFIDSDDWVHSRYLEHLYNAVIDYKVEVSISSFYRTEGDEPNIDQQKPKIELCTPEQFYITNNITAVIACAKLYKKSCFKTIRFPLAKLHEDEFTTYKILFECNKLAVISAPLYFYYKNTESIVYNFVIKQFYDTTEALELQKKFFKKNGFKSAQLYQKGKILTCLSILYNKAKLPVDKNTIRKQLKKYLVEFSVPLKDNYHIYEIAYPKRMHLYWTVKGIMSKIRGAVKK